MNIIIYMIMFKIIKPFVLPSRPVIRELGCGRGDNHADCRAWLASILSSSQEGGERVEARSKTWSQNKDRDLCLTAAI